MSQQNSASVWYKAPKRSTFTAQESVILMKQVLGSAISMVTFMRKYFDHKEYRTGTLESADEKCLIQIHLLSETSRSSRVKTLLSWMRELHKTIDKRYLRTVEIGFHYATEPGVDFEFFESYKLNFIYPNEEGSWRLELQKDSELLFKSSDDTVRSLANLLLKLGYILKNLPELDTEFPVFLAMKTYYYDETPSDFCPTGFKMGPKPVSGSGLKSMNIGSVTTNHHKATMKVCLGDVGLSSVADSLRQKHVMSHGLEVPESSAEEDLYEGESEEEFVITTPPVVPSKTPSRGKAPRRLLSQNDSSDDFAVPSAPKKGRRRSVRSQPSEL